MKIIKQTEENIMDTLNKISIFGLSAVLLFALALTANASAMIDAEAKTIVTSKQ